MATDNTLQVEVVTAERKLYSGEADAVQALGSGGQLGILPHHVPLLTTLAPGAFSIRLAGAEETIFIAGGFLEVFNNTVMVLADAAEHAEDINQARAEEARRRAQERLAQTQSNVERAQLEAELQREISRLKVAETAHRSGRRRIAAAESRQ
jgi:F-type H+-transporting ATPase subunit epsilon